jgi:hypothetical protein
LEYEPSVKAIRKWLGLATNKKATLFEFHITSVGTVSPQEKARSLSFHFTMDGNYILQGKY